MGGLRNAKGIELPVNAVIIIALAIFVLLMMAAFFSGGGKSINAAQVNTAFNEGCSQLSSSHACDFTKLEQIKTSVIENGQAKSLLDVCRMSFNNPTMSAFKCSRACQVCPKMVTEGSYCEEQADCISPLTSGWNCCFDEIKEDGTCSSQSKNKATGVCYSPIAKAKDMVIEKGTG